AAELAGLAKGATIIQNVTVKNTVDLTTRLKATADKHKLTLKTAQLGSFELLLGNAAGEELVIGYDKAANQYFIDRTSVELFADQGLTTMTDIFFASKPLTTVKLRSTQGMTFQEISNTPLVPKAIGAAGIALLLLGACKKDSSAPEVVADTKPLTAFTCAAPAEGTNYTIYPL
nr:hypothetical protein [Tanacetum cinerariifolium]